jgi:cytochrome c
MKKGFLIALISIVLVISAGVSFAGWHKGPFQKGKALWNDPKLAGSTNEKSCGTCHPNGKKVNGKKKRFKIMGKTLKSREAAINFCIEMALKGKPLQKNSEEMKSLVSYMKTLKGKKKKVIVGC